MITVTCPNCKVENSALSRRCISCGSELIIDGYIRCDNCRALTPENLEFCELCGSFLAIANGLGASEDDFASAHEPQRPPLASATPSIKDGPDVGGSGSSEDKARKSEEEPVPGWLLDVDAALKNSTSDLTPGVDKPGSTDATSQDVTGKPPESTMGDSSDKPLTPALAASEPIEETSSADWLSVLELDDSETDGAAGEESTHTGDDKPRLAEDESKTETRKSKPSTAPLKGLAVASAASQSTQPLGEKSNLLGVPQQLAGTDLPSWLSDQLQRSPDAEDQQVKEVEDIELPEPARATFTAPPTPEPEEEPEAHETVLDPSFEKWLQEFTEEPVSPDWMQEEDVGKKEADAAASAATAAETPEWLFDIHEEEGDAAEILGIDLSVEDSGRLAGLTGVIQIAPVISEAQLSKSLNGNYSLSKEHLRRIALLEGILEAVPSKPKLYKQTRPKSMPVLLRVVLAIALVVVIVLSALIPGATDWAASFSTLAVSEPLQGYDNALNSAAGSPVLVAFDYTPATAGELSPIAIRTLEQLAQNDNLAVTVSQSAAGAAVGSFISDEIPELSRLDIGYVPGEAVALRSISACMEGSGSCEMLFGQTLSEDVTAALAEVGTVLIFTSDSQRLIDWIEQVGAPLDGTVLIAGVTQSLGPVVAPYFASDQLQGVLEGSPELIVYEQEVLGLEPNDEASISSGTIVIWFVAAMLLIGAIYYGLAGTRESRSQRGAA